ncbi:hypothetical protein [Sphingomonas sp. 3-13AW]|uniref:hypothetical protein n=1 Tax=Sphingomonas sp. 3-13AW TaxID=3050450 RepID=UPI003BB669E1
MIALVAAWQAAAPADPAETRRIEVIRAETEEVLRELRNAPFEVARNSGGTVWKIKVSDIDAWTPENRLVWVTIDTSENPIYESGASKQLWRMDCTTKTWSLEVSQQIARSGELGNRYTPPSPAKASDIIPGSPVDKVLRAFCPPELE